MFGVVPVLCAKEPNFLQAKGKLCSSTVLSCLGEGDPVVVGPLWEAVIMIVAKTEVSGCGLGVVSGRGGGSCGGGPPLGGHHHDSRQD